MSRVTIASIIGLFAVAAANAGSIEIGGASGLTSNYILQGAGAVCAAGTGNCVAGSTAGWAEKNYNNTLFASATSNSGTVTPVPFTGYVQAGGTPSGLTATDAAHNVNFAMISDGVTNAVNFSSANAWISTATGGVQDSTVIPIGIQGVTDLWTMLDNQWGSLGGNDTSVTFNFGTSSNQASGYTAITVNLVDSNNDTTPAEMRAALSCLTTPSATCDAATNPHGALTQGNVINGVTVNTGVVYNTFNYTQAVGFYANTAGKLKLDDQQFVFNPSLSSDWLVSMVVTENIANTSVSSPSDPSETVLSAITVDTLAAPEPTTTLLILGGFGALGLMRLRRS